MIEETACWLHPLIARYMFLVQSVVIQFLLVALNYHLLLLLLVYFFVQLQFLLFLTPYLVQ